MFKAERVASAKALRLECVCCAQGAGRKPLYLEETGEPGLSSRRRLVPTVWDGPQGGRSAGENREPAQGLTRTLWLHEGKTAGTRQKQRDQR